MYAQDAVIVRSARRFGVGSTAAFPPFVTTLWVVLLVSICGRVAVWPRVHSVCPIYAEAGENWLNGASLYFRGDSEQATGYRYSPFATLLVVPLHLLPESAGGVLWRQLNATVFLLGFLWWLGHGVPHALSKIDKALILLLSIPLTLTSLNNGQLNTLVIGLLLMATAATAGSRWWLAGFCIGLAAGIKIYPLALGLLLWLYYPRQLTLPLLVSLLAVVGAPFLLQRPDYVLSQYADWYYLLGADDRKFLAVTSMYQDLWLLLRECQVPITPRVYLGIQVVAGAACALLCLLVKRRGYSRKALGTVALALGSCWMMLCGPATEACTYIMLAPALTYLTVAAAKFERWPPALRHLPALAYLMQLFWALTGALPRTVDEHCRVILPLATLSLSVGYVAYLIVQAIPLGPVGECDELKV